MPASIHVKVLEVYVKIQIEGANLLNLRILSP